MANDTMQLTLGGTDANLGRHAVKMREPEAPADAPEYVMQVVLGSLQFSDACLRLYGHPQLLAVAEAVNGADFTGARRCSVSRAAACIPPKRFMTKPVYPGAHA